jgi:tRNA G18 (ribose-2'-O)-methylase SpoU
MGAHFNLPIRILSWQEIAEYLRCSQLKVYLADSTVGKRYTKAEFQNPCAIIIGGEAEGAGEAARNLANEVLHIPMQGDAESLNAAVAAGVLLFEVVRQRSIDQ